MNFGYTVDERSSFAVMDAAIGAGINFFDTADVYGGPQSPDMKKGYGIAEETVGRWLRRSLSRCSAHPPISRRKDGRPACRSRRSKI